jgi:serine/threonine protein kinase
MIQRDVQPLCSTTLYIQMQLCENTLSSWLETRCHVDKSCSLSLFRQICKGLKYIHGEGIIHRVKKIFVAMVTLLGFETFEYISSS